MTVKELIVELLEMPMDADVVTTHCLINHVERPVECIREQYDYNPYHRNKSMVVLYDVYDPN